MAPTNGEAVTLRQLETLNAAGIRCYPDCSARGGAGCDCEAGDYRRTLVLALTLTYIQAAEIALAALATLLWWLA